MDIYTAMEESYKNGYAKGYADGKRDAEVERQSYRVPSKEEWREKFCTNKQLAGIRKREGCNDG